MDKRKAPDEYLIEEILEEARTMREQQAAEYPEQDAPAEEWDGPARAQAMPVDSAASPVKKKKKHSHPAQQKPTVQSAERREQPPKIKEPKRAAPPQKEPDNPVRVEEPVPKAPERLQQSEAPAKKEPPILQTAELESLLSAPTRQPAEWEMDDGEPVEVPEETRKLTWKERRAAKKQAKEEHRRAKRAAKGLEEEDDIYYGLQLKPLTEYKNEYEKTVMGPNVDSQKAPAKSVFSYLFDSTDDEVDKEISARFESLHKERRQRVEQAFKEAGVEGEDIFHLYKTNSNTIQIEFPKKDEPEKEKESISGAESTENGRLDSGAEKDSLPVSPISTVGSETYEFPSIGELNQSSRTVPMEPVDGGTFELPHITEVNVHPAPGNPPLRPSEPAEPSEPTEPTEPTEPEEPTEPSQPMEPVRPAQPEHEPAEGPEQTPLEIPAPLGTVQPAEVPEPIRAEENPQPVKEKPLQKTPLVPQEYRLAAETPVHIIEMHNFAEVILNEAKTYPKPAPLHIVSPTQEIHLKEVAAQQDTPEPDAEQPVSPEDAAAPEKPEETPAAEKEKKFAILGEEEAENDPQEELREEEPEEIDDYQVPEDASSIQHELGSSLRELFLRFSVTGILLVLMLLLSFVAEMSSFLPESIRIAIPVQTYLIIQLIFLGISSLFCGVTMWNGIKGLFRLQANSDSGIALAVIAAFIQGVALLFATGSVAQGRLHSYAVLAAAGLFLNTAGKLSLVKRINHNFRFVVSPDPKYAVEQYDDYNTALQMVKECVPDTPAVVYQHRADFLKHFLKLSYENDPSDQSSQMIAPIGLILSLVLCAACFFFSRSAMDALTAFTAGMCVCVPMANMLCVNLPLARITKVATRCGAMLAGYPAVERFCNTNTVIVDAKDLFPKGTVILNGIKTFEGQRIDDAIMDATALMYATGGPLSDLFDQIIKSRREMLPKIENITYEDGCGVIGWVAGRRVLVGNRELMISHSIQPPSRDYEEKYLTGGRQIVYFASGGDLMAMFVVSYNSDRRRAMELRRLEDNGISIIVRTCDPNITPAFLSEVFMIGKHSAGVLPERLGKTYQELIAKPAERTDAYLATKGRPTAMMRMLSACVRQRSNITIAVAMQNAAVVLGFLLVAFLSCYSGLAQLSTRALLLFELFWAAAILFIPRLRRP